MGIAIITGASSGMGRDMSKYLLELGYDLILVSRDKEKLDKEFSKYKDKVMPSLKMVLHNIIPETVAIGVIICGINKHIVIKNSINAFVLKRLTRKKSK